jgi:hypothetical protein
LFACAWSAVSLFAWQHYLGACRPGETDRLKWFGRAFLLYLCVWSIYVLLWRTRRDRRSAEDLRKKAQPGPESVEKAAQEALEAATRAEAAAKRAEEAVSEVTGTSPVHATPFKVRP